MLLTVTIDKWIWKIWAKLMYTLFCANHAWRAGCYMVYPCWPCVQMFFSLLLGNYQTLFREPYQLNSIWGKNGYQLSDIDLTHLNWSSSAHFCKTERGSLMVAGIVMWLRSLPTAFFRIVHTLKPQDRGLGAGNLQPLTSMMKDSKQS
jgi:hypothetical protein